MAQRDRISPLLVLLKSSIFSPHCPQNCLGGEIGMPSYGSNGLVILATVRYKDAVSPQILVVKAGYSRAFPAHISTCVWVRNADPRLGNSDVAILRHLHQEVSGKLRDSERNSRDKHLVKQCASARTWGMWRTWGLRFPKVGPIWSKFIFHSIEEDLFAAAVSAAHIFVLTLPWNGLSCLPSHVPCQMS